MMILLGIASFHSEIFWGNIMLYFKDKFSEWILNKWYGLEVAIIAAALSKLQTRKGFDVTSKTQQNKGVAWANPQTRNNQLHIQHRARTKAAYNLTQTGPDRLDISQRRGPWLSANYQFGMISLFQRTQKDWRVSRV